MIDWDSFQVERTIVHYVPSPDEQPNPQPLLTSALIDLDAELTQYFERKVSERLRTKGLAVVEDPSLSQDAPDALATILVDEAEFIAQSQILATRLCTVQRTNNSSGLLAILAGTVDQQTCVAIVKLERQRGVSFAINAETGTVDLALLRNLTLTDKTKVYKTALFVESPGPTLLSGYVADDQRTSARGRQVATFFLGRFLGCKPRDPASEMTFAFVKAANLSINTDVEAPDVRGQYQVALLSAIQSNTSDLCPADFAEDFLRPEHREPFLARIEAAGLNPDVTFPKDTSRVKTNEFTMTFESGMVLVGPSSARDLVIIPSASDGDAPVELHDTPERLLAGE